MTESKERGPRVRVRLPWEAAELATVMKDNSTARARWLEREYVTRISSGKPADQIPNRTDVHIAINPEARPHAASRRVTCPVPPDPCTLPGARHDRGLASGLRSIGAAPARHSLVEPGGSRPREGAVAMLLSRTH
jgi:hypothetical protein